MGDVGREGAGELQQNLAEGLSSGNLESVVQDTLGGVVSGLSGFTGALTATLAGGAALVVNAVQSQTERIDALVESAIDGVNAAYDVANARWTQEKQNQEVQDFLNENKDLLEELRPVIEGLGLDYNDFVAELAAGNLEGSGYEAILQRIVAEEEKRLANGSKLTEAESKRLTDAQRLLDVLGDVDDERRNELNVIQRTADVYDTYLLKTGQQSTLQKQIADDAERALKAVEDMPERKRVWLEFLAYRQRRLLRGPLQRQLQPGACRHHQHAQPGVPMMQVAVAVDPALYAVRLSASGATGSVAWTRRSEGRDTPVGTGALVWDYAPPLNRVLEYIAVDDADAVVSDPVEVAADGPVLSSTRSPMALPVTVVDSRPYEGQGRSVWHPVLGRSDPFVTIHAATYPAGLLRLHAPTHTVRANILELLQGGEPLLLRSTCPERVDTMTFLMTAWRDPFASDRAKGGPAYIEVDFQRVTELTRIPPPDPDRTYATVAADHADYAELLTVYASYRDLLDGAVQP